MARQKLGQHFLTQAGILERIARAACDPGEPLVIEIGPGRGPLTAQLLSLARRVVAIELDAGLVEHLRSRFAGDSRLQILEGDALAVDLAGWGPAVIAGNLPYYAATPILEHVLAAGPMLKRGVFLVQKEVGERLTARPGRREYGFLSVRTWLSADAEALFVVKPGAFRPPPKVDSVVVRLRPRNRASELGIADPAGFLAFAGLCFRSKRKTLRNNLAPIYGSAVDAWPEARMRAEQIPPEGFAELYRRTRARMP
ncbi:MAG: ribosomal RNA small subunit methyltransferase A [Bryobacterales bacterium]|nr:ribosomal RNA small subunit methyltransferase A [Bryobacterales bacterium]